MSEKLLVVSWHREDYKNFKKAKTSSYIFWNGTDVQIKQYLKLIKIFKTIKNRLADRFVIAQILSVLKSYEHNFLLKKQWKTKSKLLSSVYLGLLVMEKL